MNVNKEVDFKIVILDESQYYEEDFLKKCGGKIMKTYLFDANKEVCVAEITPSYELYPITSSAAKILSDDLYDELMRIDANDNEIKYVHVKDIKKINENYIHSYGLENIEDSSWEEIKDKYEETAKGNVVLECPFNNDVNTKNKI